MAGSDRRDKTEIGRTGARFGYVSNGRARHDEERGERAVSAAKPGTGRTGARFGQADQWHPSVQLPRPDPQELIPRQVANQPQPEPEWTEVDNTRSIVRPYAWTGGRTDTAYDLPIEALISTNRATMQRIGSRITHDHRSIADLCLATRSVAEVAALCSLPLGVARVVLGDMASAGMVVVHRTETSAGRGPDLAMMERVLIGLRNL